MRLGELVLAAATFPGTSLLPCNAKLDPWHFVCPPPLHMQDISSNAVLFSRALDSAGAAWPATLRAVDATTPMFPKAYLSLGVVTGSPAVAYTAASPDGATNRLLFARAGDATGAAFGTRPPLVVLSMETTYHSLAVVNGAPAMYVSGRGAFVAFLCGPPNTWASSCCTLLCSSFAYSGSCACGSSFYNPVSKGLRFIRANSGCFCMWQLLL